MSWAVPASTLPNAVPLASEPVGEVGFEFERIFARWNGIVGLEQVGPEAQTEFPGIFVGLVPLLVLVKAEGSDLLLGSYCYTRLNCFAD